MKNFPPPSFRASVIGYSLDDVFNISLFFGISFIVFDIFLTSFLPENFINSHSIDSSNSSFQNFKSDYYSKLTIPTTPLSDRRFSEGIFLVALIIFGISILFVNILRSALIFFNIYPLQLFFSIDTYMVLFILFLIIFEFFSLRSMIIQLRTRNRQQILLLLDQWFDEQNQFYLTLKESSHLETIPDPCPYFEDLLIQYYKVKNDFSLKKVFLGSLIFSLVFDIIFILARTSLINIIGISATFIIMFLFMGIIAKLANKVDNSFSLKYHTGGYTVMIDSFLQSNFHLLVNEVRKFEFWSIKNENANRSSSNARNDSLFWYFKSRLFMISGNYYDGSVILLALYKKFSSKYLFHAEIAYLLSQCYQHLGKDYDSQSYLSEALKLFQIFSVDIHF